VLSEGELSASPRWFPLRLAPSDGEVTLVGLDEAAYSAASFLDERVLDLNYPQATCALAVARSAASSLVPRAHFVFHTGHVGSTLISRLIGAHPAFFSLREPALLRTLAAGNPDPQPALSLEAVVALLSRTWRADQRVVIKATSFVNELAGDLLGLSDQAVAIMMYASPSNYLRGILAGPNSRVESRSLAPSRLRRLTRRLAGKLPVEPRSEGEQIAMSWLCEMTALHQVAQRFPSRVLWVDFDAFLQDPVCGLGAIFRRLGADCSANELDALIASPITRQYSKAPEYSYDATLRREVLALADLEHQPQIMQGMAWLQRLSATHPLAAAIVRQTGK
jgi:hypothetical protein